MFVLATTDPQKVLPTIRVAHPALRVHAALHEELAGHLADILAREGIEADADAIDLIARKAGGSARDALSLSTRRSRSAAAGSTALEVQAAFGGVPFEQRVAVLHAVSAAKMSPARSSVCTRCCVAGHDARRIADDLLRTFRDAFLCANASGRVPYDGPAEEAARLTDLAERMGNVALVRGIEMMGQAIVDIRGQAIADRVSCWKSRSSGSPAAKPAPRREVCSIGSSGSNVNSQAVRPRWRPRRAPIAPVTPSPAGRSPTPAAPRTEHEGTDARGAARRREPRAPNRRRPPQPPEPPTAIPPRRPTRA